MKSAIARDGYSTVAEAEAAGREYRWKSDASDGLRSYSYNASNSNWDYSEIENPNKTTDERYTFTDSSTGQPSARRGNLYNLTAATLGSSLKLTAAGQQAPDSICPRGWQLPVSDIGSDASRVDKFPLRDYGVTVNNTSAADYNRFVSWPLQYLPAGSYYADGYVISRTTQGRWWIGVIRDINTGHLLSLNNGQIFNPSYAPRGYGSARRCVGVFLAFL